MLLRVVVRKLPMTGQDLVVELNQQLQLEVEHVPLLHLQEAVREEELVLLAEEEPPLAPQPEDLPVAHDHQLVDQHSVR